MVGLTQASRVETVRGMVERHGRDRVGYWLQLILAMGIATFGLVLGSTGVVIGAMLVSPLMGPLVEIGMGLAVGSPLLVLHSAFRTGASLITVIGASAVLTLLLPYHDLNAEILARTSPTLLDLYVASFCALAAAYTTARQGSDTVTAAAGTAISIALVPPLCVVGWGLGSERLDVALGAALLFTANLCAILLFTVVVFLSLAFDAVDLDAIELGDDSPKRRLLDRLALRMRAFFGSRFGPALRVLMPVVFVAIVIVPLRRALDEVAWATRTRAEVQHILDALPIAKHAVRSSLGVERRSISVRLVIVGNGETAGDLKRELAKQIRDTTGVVPSLDVVAVPDLEAVRAAAEALAKPVASEAPKPDVDLARQELDAALRHRWPAAAVGDLATWRLVVGADGKVTVDVVHFGAALGPAGEAMLADALSERLGHSVSVRDLALATEPAEAAPEHGLEWTAALERAVDQLLAAGIGAVCITTPPPENPRGRGAPVRGLVDAQVAAQIARLPPARVRAGPGASWGFRLSPAPCPVPDARAGGGGLEGDGGRDGDGGTEAGGDAALQGDR
jgi:uncharacterized hydrophobic protein (TIGR00271 family)